MGQSRPHALAFHLRRGRDNG
ncbi:carboxymuconolactone decarboxylase family protein, partial [Chromobacterium piscinae]